MNWREVPGNTNRLTVLNSGTSNTSLTLTALKQTTHPEILAKTTRKAEESHLFSLRQSECAEWVSWLQPDCDFTEAFLTEQRGRAVKHPHNEVRRPWDLYHKMLTSGWTHKATGKSFVSGDTWKQDPAILCARLSAADRAREHCAGSYSFRWPL